MELLALMLIEPFLKRSESRVDLPSATGAGAVVQVVTARLAKSLAILLAEQAEGKLQDEVIKKILVKRNEAILGNQKIVKCFLGQVAKLRARGDSAFVVGSKGVFDLFEATCTVRTELNGNIKLNRYASCATRNRARYTGRGEKSNVLETVGAVICLSFIGESIAHGNAPMLTC